MRGYIRLCEDVSIGYLNMICSMSLQQVNMFFFFLNICCVNWEEKKGRTAGLPPAGCNII